jgi:hypothetical protein
VLHRVQVTDPHQRLITVEGPDGAQRLDRVAGR